MLILRFILYNRELNKIFYIHKKNKNQYKINNFHEIYIIMLYNYTYNIIKKKFIFYNSPLIFKEIKL